MNVWDLFKLDGKVGLVTGGARNLGYDMALALAEAGADVAIVDLNRESAEAVAKEVSACDVRSVSTIRRTCSGRVTISAGAPTRSKPFSTLLRFPIR